MSWPGFTFTTPGIYNVLDPWYNDPIAGWVGMVANDSTVADRNTKVLQAIINFAQTTDCTNAHPYGVTIVFPGHSQTPNLNDPNENGHDKGAEYFLYSLGGMPAAPAIAIGCNWPLRFLGTGNVKLTMQIDNPISPVSGDMFQVNTGLGAGENTGGITFEDLTFKYPTITQSSSTAWAAIHANDGAENVRIVRCVFSDCPIAVWFEKTLQCSMLQSTVRWYTNYGVALMLGDTTSGNAAKEIFITDCLFGQDPAAPNNSTGMFIQSCDQVFVTDCHIDSLTNGIEIVPGPTGWNAAHLHFSGCTVYTGPNLNGYLGNCVLIQPQGSGVAVAQVVFTSCFFELGEGATIQSGHGGPGIKIDASLGAVNTVRFVSCYSTRWPGPGLELTGVTTGQNLQPTNVEVVGGMYAANNFPTGMTSPNSYGIWLNVAQNVRISGAACQGQYHYITGSGQFSSPSAQDVGIWVDGGAAGVVIDGCDCTHNNKYGVYVAGGASDVIIEACDVRSNITNAVGIEVNAATTPVTDIFIRDCNARGFTSYSMAISISGGSNAATVQVTNCAGYNDQGVLIASTPPASGTTTFYNYSLGTGYFGPLEFYTQQGTGGAIITEIDIDGHNTHLTSGSFFLAPGESAAITWHPSGLSVISFMAIGK